MILAVGLTPGRNTTWVAHCANSQNRPSNPVYAAARGGRTIRILSLFGATVAEALIIGIALLCGRNGSIALVFGMILPTGFFWVSSFIGLPFRLRLVGDRPFCAADPSVPRGQVRTAIV